MKDEEIELKLEKLMSELTSPEYSTLEYDETDEMSLAVYTRHEIDGDTYNFISENMNSTLMELHTKKIQTLMKMRSKQIQMIINYVNNDSEGNIS